MYRFGCFPCLSLFILLSIPPFVPPHCEIRNRGSFFFSFFSLSFSFSLYSLLLISHVVIVIASVPNTPQATFRPLNNRPAVLIVCEFPLAADLQTIVGLEGQKSTLSQLPKKALESSFFDHDKLSISFFFFFFRLPSVLQPHPYFFCANQLPPWRQDCDSRHAQGYSSRLDATCLLL